MGMGNANLLLQALLEAKGDSKSKAKAAEAEEPEDTAAEGEDPGAEDTDPATENPEEGTEDEGGEDNQPEEEENQDDDETENEEQTDEENPEEGDESSEDDFSMDPEEGEGESSENPDGLPDPDDDGSDDMSEEEGEVNVHTNILQLSKMDRAMAKRKCFADYQELRTSITSFKNLVNANEATIEADIRDYVIEKLDRLYSSVTDYLTYKFSYINYEENLQNYLIFMKSLNDLTVYVKTGDDPKKSKKLTVDSAATAKKVKQKPKKKEKVPEDTEGNEPAEDDDIDDLEGNIEDEE